MALNKRHDSRDEEVETFEHLPDPNAGKVPLCSIPTELLLAILAWLEPSDLMRLDLCCRWLYARTQMAYKSWYGWCTPHRQLDTPPQWKNMVSEVVFVAGEHGEKLREAEKTPDHVINQILDEYYTCEDSDLYMCARSSIIALLTARKLDRSVYEALAIATAAQYRTEEAISLYRRALSMQGSLYPHIWLTAARFSSQIPDTLLNLSIEKPPRVVMEKAMFGAAASGNIEMMTRLHSLGTPLDLQDAHETLATVAASNGRESILRYLYNHGLAFSQHAAITQEAAKYGHSNIILYLMSVGACMDWTHLINAIHHGNIDVISVVLDERPSMKSLGKEDSALVISELFKNTWNLPKRTELLAFFTNSTDIGIDARQYDDRTALHLAAADGDMQAIVHLLNAGASISLKDVTGQTPCDLALNAGYFKAAALVSELTEEELRGVRHRKYSMALKIIESRRRLHIDSLARRTSGDTPTERKSRAIARWTDAKMDDRLANIWIKHLSSSTLSCWHQLLYGEVEELTKKYLHICAGTLPVAEPHFERESASDALTLASRLGEKLLPSWVSPIAAANVAYECSCQMDLEQLHMLDRFYKEGLGAQIIKGEQRKENEVLHLVMKWLPGGGYST